MSKIQFQQVVVAEGVIDLGVGQPNNAILPVDYIRRAAAIQFTDSPEFLQYGAEWGDGRHRVALGEFLTEAYGTLVAAEQLTVAPAWPPCRAGRRLAQAVALIQHLRCIGSRTVS